MATPINLQSNYPVLAQQDADWNRLLHTAVDRFAPASLRLPAFGGSLENRALAAAWLNTPVARVLIAEAGHHGLLASLMAASLVGKTVAVEALTYPWFVRQAQMLNMRVVPIALDVECMIPEALRAACNREKIDAIYSMPSLHNPTGAVASLARRQAIVSVARDHNLTIIEDAAYAFLLPNEPPRYTTLAPERAFYIESLSKRAAPGLRTAFVVSPEHLATQTELALRLVASGSSTLLASLGCAMAADGSLAAIIGAKRKEGALRQAKAITILKGLEMITTPNSWHLWITLPDGLGTDEDIELECESRGVLITGAKWFTAPDTKVPRAVRIGLGGETEWQRVEEGLKVFTEIARG